MSNTPPNDDPYLIGAEALVHTLIAGDVTTCFANPGTSEMHFVSALDRIPGIRCVLGLQENVVTGMADGYFRVTGKPASTLLHCGPGLANGIANLHNARRAGAGIVNIVGDHAVPHVAFDSPLTADVVSLAETCSDWVAYSASPASIGADAARAIQAARADNGHVASLILPADVSWNEGGKVGGILPDINPQSPSPLQIDRAVAACRSGGRVVMVLGSAALGVEAQPLLAGLQQAGIDLRISQLAGLVPVGRGRMAIPRVPYVVDVALEALAPYDHVILVNCPPPTAFFLYPGRPSRVTRPDAEVFHLSRPEQDAIAALQALAGRLEIEPCSPPVVARPFTEVEGRITPDGLAEIVCSLMPENAIISDESLTQGAGFPSRIASMAPCQWMTMVGGAIGGGLPMATGAAIGAAENGESERRIVSLQADGSAAYTMQSLWTQARENLPCTTVLLNNRKYEILLGEYAKVGANPGETAHSMLSLDKPAIDWAGLAQSFGVMAKTVTTLEELRDAFEEAIAHDGPYLINAMMG